MINFQFTELAAASSLRPNVTDELLGQITEKAEAFVPGRTVLVLFRRRVGSGDVAPEAAIKLALEAGRAGVLTEAEQYGVDQLDDSVRLTATVMRRIPFRT